MEPLNPLSWPLLNKPVWLAPCLSATSNSNILRLARNDSNRDPTKMVVLLSNTLQSLLSTVDESTFSTKELVCFFQRKTIMVQFFLWVKDSPE